MATTADELREEVRRRYADSARAVTGGNSGDCDCGSGSGCAGGESAASKFGEALYDAEQRGELPEAATLASLGCGNLTAVAELSEGETLLDLGSGSGIDAILSAKRVGPTGIAYGLDMTDEMLALAQKNAAEAGVRNVHLLKGVIEQIPLRSSRAGGSGSVTSSPKTTSPRSNGQNAAPMWAASRARFPKASMRRGSRRPASSRCRSSSRTRSPTACTARSSRRSRRASRSASAFLVAQPAAKAGCC